MGTKIALIDSMEPGVMVILTNLFSIFGTGRTLMMSVVTSSVLCLSILVPGIAIAADKQLPTQVVVEKNKQGKDFFDQYVDSQRGQTIAPYYFPDQIPVEPTSKVSKELSQALLNNFSVLSANFAQDAQIKHLTAHQRESLATIRSKESSAVVLRQFSKFVWRSLMGPMEQKLKDAIEFNYEEKDGEDQAEEAFAASNLSASYNQEDFSELKATWSKEAYLQKIGKGHLRESRSALSNLSSAAVPQEKLKLSIRPRFNIMGAALELKNSIQTLSVNYGVGEKTVGYLRQLGGGFQASYQYDIMGKISTADLSKRLLSDKILVNLRTQDSSTNPLAGKANRSIGFVFNHNF